MDRTAEYQALRQELTENKRFVFERPLLLFAATLTAASVPALSAAFPFLPAALAGAVGFNLWFTENRLSSSSRIVAFLTLAHENPAIAAVGWEDALREWRVYQAAVRITPTQVKPIAYTNEVGEAPQYDHNRFYAGIFWTHAFILLLITLTTLAYGLAEARPVLTLGLSPPTIVTANIAAIVGCAAALVRYNPWQNRQGIEWNLQQWCGVFGERVPSPRRRWYAA